MKSLVVKRSIVLAGHKTSISLEEAFWKSLKEIATQRQAKVATAVITASHAFSPSTKKKGASKPPIPT
jgi:predicted DNA-binding ribbon-helix-helix protein